MIFVARVYYAHFIEEQLDSKANLGTFSFATYPVLKKMFQCIESHMREVAKPNPKSPAKAKSPVDVVITLQTQLNGLEKTSSTLEKGLRNARATCTVLLQKLKYLERGKAKAKTTLTTERDAIVAEVLAAVKETGKRKRKKHKKKKRHKKHRSS
jgi:septal ring factor EnvC (AmiA/AmiB activator)